MRKLIRVQLFCTFVDEGLWLQLVVCSGSYQQRDRIGLADFDGSCLRTDAHRATFVEHLDLPLVIAAKQGHGPFERQQISLRRERAGALFHREKRDFGPHDKGERTLPIGGEPDDHHIVRIGGKILALIAHPVMLIRNVGDGFVQME